MGNAAAVRREERKERREAKEEKKSRETEKHPQSYDRGVSDGAFGLCRWMFFLVFLSAFVSFSVVVGPKVDDQYRMDVSDVMQTNYHARREWESKNLPWRSYERREVQGMYSFLFEVPESSHQSHLWKDKVWKAVPGWLVGKQDRSAKESLGDGKGTEDDDTTGSKKTKSKKKKKSRDVEPEEKATRTTLPSSTVSREAWERTSRFREESATLEEAWKEERYRCERQPWNFDPTSWEPYFLDETCEEWDGNFTTARRDEVVDLMFFGERRRLEVEETDEALRESLLWDLFYLGTSRAHCAKHAVQFRGSSRDTDLFVLFAGLETAVCNRICGLSYARRPDEDPGRREALLESLKRRMGVLKGTNPWLLGDDYRSNATLLEDAHLLLSSTEDRSSAVKAMENPWKGVRAVGGDLPSWSYACDLRNDILRHGGVLALIDTPWEMFVNYRDGVYASRRLGPLEPTRQRLVVLLIGWGISKAEDGAVSRYYIAAAPFGRGWGVRGCIRIDERELAFRDDTRRDLIFGVAFDL